MLDQLTALDATFLELEQMDEGATMHIGGVMVFDPLPDGGAPALDAVRDDIAARLTSLPRYTQRLSAEHVGGLAWPRWQADPSFDLRNHVHRAAVPAPGGDPELCEWAAEYFSHRLDRTRPLWEMVLVEGLAEGRWAIATKTHHALVDGVGSVDALNVMLAPEPPAPSAEQQSNETRAGWEAIVPHPPRAVVDLTRSGARAAAGGLHAALHPREAFEKSRALAEVIVHDAITGAPQTSLNVPIGPTRRYEIVRIPLEELKAIGHEFGGSLNDAVLAACATGLRKLLIARNEQLPSAGLRAMVPVNIRTASEHLALGNRISSLFVELPVAEPLAHARARQIVERMTALKSSRAALGAATAVDVSSLAPPILHPLLARTLYGTRLFNLTITNVPGPSEALYACGAPLREVHPLVPLAAEHAVGVAVMSCNGSVVLGLSADCDSMPDFDVFVDGVRGGLDELRGLLAGSSDAGPAGRTPARRTEPVRASR
ncbi:MAG TPA: wax ester/triacylglycerol synthase family O-acyltransferase [Solirubrobacteraceae bacterium]|nr:wax ester/triacylglycerol synthase family O-acyltransferase [Solirubrobacteraceae bacterium]